MMNPGRSLRVLAAILVAGAFVSVEPVFAKKLSPLIESPPLLELAAAKKKRSKAAARKAKKKIRKKKIRAKKKKAVKAGAAATGAVAKTPATPLETAIAKAKSGDDAEARAAAKKLADPVALSLVEWILIRGGSIDRDYRRILAFAHVHPHWPSMTLIRRRAESALLRSSPSPDAVFAFFNEQGPISTQGRIAWAEAHLARGNRGRAGDLIRRVWRHDLLSEKRESEILEKFGDLIRDYDHRQRYADMLFQNEPEAGLRAAERVGGDDLALAKAWAAHLRREKDSGSKLDAVPETMKRHPGFLLSLLQHLRREGKERLKDALIVLDYMPSDPLKLGAPDQWWEERRRIARQLLDEGDAHGAYKAASGPLPSSPAERVEADFLAGWIALRFVKNADLAKMHFSRLLHDVTTPISVSRARYWLGRAYEALGERDEARKHYTRAAEHGSTFYGQLATQKIGRTRIHLPPPPQPTPEERAAFTSSDVARAARMLLEAGEKSLALSFATLLADALDKPTHLALLAELVSEIGEPRHLVRLGKKAVQRNHPLEIYAFPTAALPTFSPLRDDVETALVYAIARQESLFNPVAKSHVGARGLMQLMPATARMMAKLNKVNYSLEKLTSDPAYNLQLGSAFLGRLLDRYRGSYIMTFAAYNAGPGRVQDWVEKYGDPRTGQIEPTDWIELIPFNETRNYVQRVMENVQVYRTRLNGDINIDFEGDLKRGAQES